MDVLIPRFVNTRIFQAVVRTEIDNATTGIKQLRHRFHTRRMRQAAESDVTQFSSLLRRERFASQIKQAGERWMNFMDVRPVLLTSRRGDDFCFRMASKKFQEFECRVTSRAKNRNACHEFCQIGCC